MALQFPDCHLFTIPARSSVARRGGTLGCSDFPGSSDKLSFGLSSPSTLSARDSFAPGQPAKAGHLDRRSSVTGFLWLVSFAQGSAQQKAGSQLSLTACDINRLSCEKRFWNESWYGDHA
jgi:hypothetical protein